MLIAQFNGYRIRIPMAFRLDPFRLLPSAIMFATRYSISRGNEGSILHPKQTPSFVYVLSRLLKWWDLEQVEQLWKQYLAKEKEPHSRRSQWRWRMRAAETKVVCNTQTSLQHKEETRSSAKAAADLGSIYFQGNSAVFCIYSFSLLCSF